MNSVKIVIIGPSGVGKTTLKKIFFEQESAFNLLKKSLEPTVGIETNLYNLNAIIAVHDLAGQQLEEWFTSGEEIFADTDLILCILNIKSDWNTQVELWNRLLKARDSYCPNAEIIVLFHKVDLLTKEDLEKLKEKVKIISSGVTGVSVFFTSITPKYYIDTLKVFLFILKRYTTPDKPFDSKKIAIKYEITNYISINTSANIDELKTQLKYDNFLLHRALKELIAQKIVLLNPILNEYSLSENGKKNIAEFQNTLKIQMNKLLIVPNKFLHALILSEQHGRSFFAFEHQKDYFQEMFPDNRTDSDGVATLISMFFTAIGDYGTTISHNGVSSINIIGSTSHILFIQFHDIFGIFFLNNLKPDNSVINLCRELLKEVYEGLKEEIQEFIKTGSAEDLNKRINEITIKIKKLDDDLSTKCMIEQDISQEKLIHIYQQLSEGKFSELDVTLLKNIIFKLLLQDSTMIVEQVSKSY